MAMPALPAIEPPLYRDAAASKAAPELPVSGADALALGLKPGPKVGALLEAVERWWIAYGRALGWPLTNLTAGGEGSAGRPVSPETRAKMRASNLGQKRHPSVGQAIAAKHRGRVFSPETLAKMRIANRFKRVGTKHSAETRAKMSAARTGKRRGPYEKATK